MERLAASLADLYAALPDADHALACRFAPDLWLDAHEPFRPLAAGYTIFRRDGRSLSFPRSLQFTPQTATIIEYAIWWDWDIHHLYELEHVWLHLDAAGQIIRTEGSWHGRVNRLHLPPLFVSPGKHAFATNSAAFHAQHRRTPGLTSHYAGSGGIGGKELYDDRFRRTPPGDRRIATWLKQHAFTPAWRFDVRFSFHPEMLVPWPSLRDWIPRRVAEWQAVLADWLPLHAIALIRTAVCPTPTAVPAAAQSGMEMVFFPARTLAGVFRILLACQRHRLAAYLHVQNGRLIPWLGRLFRRRDWTDYVMFGSEKLDWLTRLKRELPAYRTAVILPRFTSDALQLADQTNASYLHFRNDAGLTTVTVRQAHDRDLGVLVGMTAIPPQNQLGVDGVVVGR